MAKRNQPKAYFVYAHLPPEGGCKVYAAWGKHGEPQGQSRMRFYDTLPASIRGGRWVSAYSAATAKEAVKHSISCRSDLAGGRRRRSR